MFTTAASVLGLAALAAAQFPPTPEDVKVLKSKIHDGVKITYKEPGICETTTDVKSYAGHVHLPRGFLDDEEGEKQDYDINTFFWFFESRIGAENAPLAIWLNGGPGGSSMMGVFQENGPCILHEDLTTEINPWSWNNEVNMLYIDEPNQVGFSYDTPTNCTVEYSEENGAWVMTPADFSDGVPETNLTHRVGTFASQQSSHTTNSTAQAAHALWHFAQTWFTEFPHYKPNDDKISMWAESYGGHYGPAFMRFFQQQNEKIQDGTIEDEHAHYLHLDTLGIINGYMDAVIQTESYIDFPYNNTYGLQIFSDELYQELKHNWTKPNGCKDQIQACQDELKGFDVATVNLGKVNVAEICGFIEEWCEEPAVKAYQDLNKGWFDIAAPKADPFPPPYIYGYLSQPEVLQAIGSPVNYSAISTTVASNFASTLDIVHGGFLDAIGYLLDSGVKVHLLYGDRDYACNWMGGEAASLAVPYSRAHEFARSRYDIFFTSDGFTGLTRQVGNYSFTRVFQAGHEIPAYQPVSMYEAFLRATFNYDMSSGYIPLDEFPDYFTPVAPEPGRDSRSMPQVPPEEPEPRCYVLHPESCTPEVWEKVQKGLVKVENYFVTEVLEESVDDIDEL